MPETPVKSEISTPTIKRFNENPSRNPPSLSPSKAENHRYLYLPTRLQPRSEDLTAVLCPYECLIQCWRQIFAKTYSSPSST